jgi:phospholipid/cholesterol/gamma-HCH transport system permease protein
MSLTVVATRSDAHLVWQLSPTGGTLQLAADWRGFVPTPEQAAPPGLTKGVVRVDVQQLKQWDANLTASLWALLSPLVGRGLTLDLSNLPVELSAPLHLALQARSQHPELLNAQGVSPKSPAGWFGQHLSWTDLRQTISFIGELLLAMGRLRQRPGVFRATDLLHHMDQMGPHSLPIVSLTTFLVGLMLAYMGGAQLDRIGAPALIADVVTVGVVRELAALMTGVILAGRVGAAIAAELGTMVVKDEIDALRALGIDPMLHLVLPRLFGMLLTAPFLIAFAMVVGVLAGLPAAYLAYGVSAPEYLNKSLAALNWTHLWIGLFKGTMYTLLVVVAGCREGLYAGHNAQAIGVATTRAVVKALVWIVVAACASTVVLQSLGF